MLRFTLQLTAVLNKGLEIFKAIFLTFYNTEQSSTLITDNARWFLTAKCCRIGHEDGIDLQHTTLLLQLGGRSC